MVEGEESGWLSELEKKGLHQVAEILENFGINSETDVSLLDRDDFFQVGIEWAQAHGRKEARTLV